MIIHHVDRNSTWVEPLKNQTEGVLIAAQTKILKWMWHQGIVPKHQILDNQCSERMKLAMEATMLADGLTSTMMYKIVPPNDHWRNIAKKGHLNIQGPFYWSPEQLRKNACPCTCGANYYCRWNNNYSYFANHVSTQAC